MEIIDVGFRGTLVRHRLPAGDLPGRPVDVWLPPGADLHGAGGRRVVYCHDGQNLFRSADAYGGVPWDLPEAALAAAAETGVAAPVLVGVWHAGELRGNEFLPPEPTPEPTGTGVDQLARALAVGRPSADRYVRLVVDDVFPLVESVHGVSARRGDRVVLGSSMGGLAALYLALTRPEVVSAAACVSTNFIVGGDPLVDWFAARLPPPGRLRLWFDRGTETLDGEYGPTQDRMDAALRGSALVEGRDWVSLVFRGADHSERAWADRAHQVLAFLLG